MRRQCLQNQKRSIKMKSSHHYQHYPHRFNRKKPRTTDMFLYLINCQDKTEPQRQLFHRSYCIVHSNKKTNNRK